MQNCFLESDLSEDFFEDYRMMLCLLNTVQNPNLQVNYVTDIGNRAKGTLLNFAVRTRSMDTIPLLLRRGANPSKCDCRGKSPLQAAIKNRDTITVSFLMYHGAIPAEHDLAWASRGCYVTLALWAVSGFRFSEIQWTGIPGTRNRREEILDVFTRAYSPEMISRATMMLVTIHIDEFVMPLMLSVQSVSRRYLSNVRRGDMWQEEAAHLQYHTDVWAKSGGIHQRVLSFLNPVYVAGFAQYYCT